MADKVNLSGKGGGLTDWFQKVFYNPDVIKRRTAGLKGADLANAQAVIEAASQAPLGTKGLTVGGKQVANTGLGTTLGLGWDKIANNKLKAAGAGALGLGNVAGLFDNPYWGGQAIGTGAGIGLPFLLSKTGLNLGGYGRTMAALGGGFLGSLFDKLRANQAEQEQYQGQY